MITKFKIFENVQYSKKILSELKIPDTNTLYNKLKDMLVDNPGYLGKFTEWLFKDRFDFDLLNSLYQELSSFKLDRPIDQFGSPEEVYDYITQSKSNIKINQALKSLPSNARNLVNQELRDLIFNNIKYVSNIMDFYSKKGGRYKDIKTLINDTKTLIKNLNGGWSVDSIEYNEDELIYRDDHTLILWISDYNRSKVLGSQHWCISSDKSNWSYYTEDFNRQYFIYDFTKDIGDKKSMIGVTVNLGGGIRAAHYKDDTSIDNTKYELKEYKDYLKPYNRDDLRSVVRLDDIPTIVKYGFTEELKISIQKIDISNRYGYERLIDIAIMNDHSDIAILLINDAKFHNDGLNMDSILLLAVECENNDLIELLINDESLDLKNLNHVLLKACTHGNIDLVEILLKDPRADPSYKNNNIVYSSTHHIDVFKLLLNDPRVDPSDDDNSVIRKACDNRHIEAIRILLDDPRVDPSDKNNYCIRIACHKGDLKMIKMLMSDPKVDPSVNNNTCLYNAAMRGYGEVVGLLLKDPRVDPSDNNNRIIKIAIKNQRNHIVKMLLNDPRMVNKNNWMAEE